MLNGRAEAPRPVLLWVGQGSLGSTQNVLCPCRGIMEVLRDDLSTISRSLQPNWGDKLLHETIGGKVRAELSALSYRTASPTSDTQDCRVPVGRLRRATCAGISNGPPSLLKTSSDSSISLTPGILLIISTCHWFYYLCVSSHITYPFPLLASTKLAHLGPQRSLWWGFPPWPLFSKL